MLEPAHQINAGIVLLTVVAVAYGGWFLFRTLSGGFPANDLQKSFFRAGHAHAGVLVILGLLTMLIVQTNDVPEPFATLSFGVLAAAILMPAGFFLSVIGRNPARPNRAIVLLWIGAGALTVGVVSAGIGLIVRGVSG